MGRKPISIDTILFVKLYRKADDVRAMRNEIHEHANAIIC